MDKSQWNQSRNSSQVSSSGHNSGSRIQLLSRSRGIHSQWSARCYDLHDEGNQQPMAALAAGAESMAQDHTVGMRFEGHSRATGESRIEKLLQVPEFNELVNCLSEETEREGFEPPMRY